MATSTLAADSEMRDVTHHEDGAHDATPESAHINGFATQHNSSAPQIPHENGIRAPTSSLPAKPVDSVVPPAPPNMEVDAEPISESNPGPADSTLTPSAKNETTPVPAEDTPSQPAETQPNSLAVQPSSSLPVTPEPTMDSQPVAAANDDTQPSSLDADDSSKPAPVEDTIPPSFEDPLGAASPPSAVEPVPAASVPDSKPSAPSLDQEMSDAPAAAAKVSREREDDEFADGPSAKRPRTDEQMVNGLPEPSDIPAVASEEKKPLADVATKSTEYPPEPVSTPAALTQPAATPATPAASGAAPGATPAEPHAITGDFGPMTENAAKKLLEGMRNIKKSKSAPAFSKPVDPVALNIPTYFDIVKKPMDLGTMEQKLRSKQYAAVNEYVDDFNQMVANAVLFNGQAHPIAQAAMALQAAVNAQLKKLPKPGEAPTPVPAPPPKSRQPSLPKPAAPPVETKRRDSRPSAAAAAAGAQSPTAPSGTFAAPNGVPTIRRDSTLGNRPKREIHKPPPRDLPYAGAKPRKKKFQAELQFCGEVLTDLRRQRYEQYLGFFNDPVDPVALNIPTYRKVIKNPMDISTIASKYENNQYQNAKEFEKDWHLMFNNCYKFNGPDHPVSRAGKDFEAIFNSEMAKKDAWLATHAPASGAQSPVAETDSEVEQEEDSEDEAEAARNAQLAQMHAQIAALQAQTAALMGAGTNKKKEKGPKVKKEKAAKGNKPGRKSGGGAAAKEKKPKTKAQKNRPLTTREKEEIVSKIGELDPSGMTRAAELIKASFRRAGLHELANKPDDDLEFDIEIIPDDGLHSLLNLIRELLPAAVPSTEVLHSHSSHRHHGGGSAKAKKNKPMTSREQQDAVRALEQQIAGFDSGAADDDEDGSSEDEDEDESGSESEEE